MLSTLQSLTPAEVERLEATIRASAPHLGQQREQQHRGGGSGTGAGGGGGGGGGVFWISVIGTSSSSNMSRFTIPVSIASLS